jgi:glutathione synthase/RimK-type ligase-like ATP-grasp enzyme
MKLSFFFKKVLLLFFQFKLFNLIGAIKLYNRKSSNIIWIYRKSAIDALRSGQLVTDIALINSLIKLDKEFRIVFSREIGNISNSNIFFNLRDDYNFFKFENYVHVLDHLTLQLEDQNNKLLYTNWEISFWENKIHMHNVFDELHISTPQTRLIKSFEEAEQLEMKFPFLMKKPHSCSANGIFEIRDINHLVNEMSKLNISERREGVLVQDLIEMRRDLRVILVGDEIVLHYWRINMDKDWKPTSTGFGSVVDFDNFPEQWRSHIIETFKKLNLKTGAFDITWQNDDLMGTPLYLEVSPAYMPNPRNFFKDEPYSKFKSDLRLNNSYESEYVKIVYKIKLAQVKEFFKSI